MALQLVDNGTVAGDDTGDNLFDAFAKVNDNFTELYAGALDLTQVRTVSKGAFGFTSIQDAIDDITDADAARPYTVYVYPGIYTEQVTMKPFVSLRGVDPESVIVTFTGNNNGTIIGASDTMIASLTVELSDVDTEWGIVFTDPERAAIKDVNLRGASEYAYTSNGVKATGTGYRLTMEGCRIMFGTDVDAVVGVYYDLAPSDPLEQEVVFRNCWIMSSYADDIALHLEGMRNVDLIGMDIQGAVEIVDCSYIATAIGCKATTISLSAGTGITTYLRLSGVYLDSEITTSGVGTMRVSGSYSVARVLGSGAVPMVVPGGVLRAYTPVTSTYAVLYTDEVVTCDATGGAFTATLPTAVGHEKKVFTIKRLNSGANAVTVGTTSSQTIDGSTTYSLSAQYASITVISDGANWHIIGKV